MAVDGLAFKNTDNTKWGAGNGSGTGGNLASLQADMNTWLLRQRIKALEDNPPVAVGIESVTVIGSQFQLEMTDGSTLGPYTLPIATFSMEGDWLNNFHYDVLDLFTVAGFGLYMTLIAHTTPVSPAEFDPAAVDEDTGSPTFGQPLYKLIFGDEAYVYDFGFFYPGKPGIGIEENEPIAGHLFIRNVNLPIGIPGSKFRVDVAHGVDTSYPIEVDGVNKGSIDFEAGETAGTLTWAAAVDVLVDQKFSIIRPTEVDTDARNLYATFMGVRTS